MNKTLYELDFGQWIEEQAIALKNRDASALDWGNLQEEIESLGVSDKRAINSLTRQLLIHLLLYTYWSINRDFYLSGWKIEINNFRNDLSDFLDSQNYYKHFKNNLDKNYGKAVKQVQLKAENANLSFINYWRCLLIIITSLDFAHPTINILQPVITCYINPR